MTDDEELITAVESNEPIGNSDHLAVQFFMFLRFTSAINDGTTKNVFDWIKTDFESMNLYLSHYDWPSLFLYNPSALSLWDSFSSVLKTAVEIHVPKYKSMPKCIKTKRKLYPKHLRNLRAKNADFGAF